MTKLSYIELIESKTQFFIDISHKDFAKFFSPRDFMTQHDFMIAGIASVAMIDEEIKPEDYREILEAENAEKERFERFINNLERGKL